MYEEFFFVSNSCLVDYRQRNELKRLVEQQAECWKYTFGAVITRVTPEEISYICLEKPTWIAGEELEKWAEERFPRWLELAAIFEARIFSGPEALKRFLKSS